MFGKHGLLLWEYANGIDKSEVSYLAKKPKGIGNSVTLPKDLDSKEELYNIIFALSEQVTYRLRRENMVARTVNIQLRTNNFIDFSHQGKLAVPTSNTKDIYEMAKKLLNEMYKSNLPIRLVGVRIDNLEEKVKGQISLFEENKSNEKQEKIDTTLDLLKEKYGYNCITRASKLSVEDLVKNKLNISHK